jgi:hypothetical protein
MKIRISVILVFLAFTVNVKAQFKNFVSIGYTSASVKHMDLGDFAASAKNKLNNGANIEVSQKNRGINFGYGLHTSSQGEFSPYIRLMGNLNIMGGKAMEAGNTILKTRSSALDVMLALGIMTAKGSTFYGLIGPSFMKNNIKVSGNPLIEGKYSSYLSKLSYGLGLAYVGHTGSGLSVDAYCNFKEKSGSKYYQTSSSKKLASDYESFSADVQNYQGKYISNGLTYFRLQLTVFLSLTKK